MGSNESDFDLLKAAAEAVAYYHDGFDSALGHDVWWLQDQARFGAWNPLGDDGDALRLAVKLRLQVAPGTYGADCSVFCAGQAQASEPSGNDPFAAPRRAIVRAAAEIGKTKG